MSELIILLNDVVDGMRRLHVMSDAPIGDEWKAQVPEGIPVNIYQDEIKLHHLEAIWVPRGDLVRFERHFNCGPECPVCHGKGCAWHLQLTLFMLEKDERMSQAIEAAAVEYALKTGRDPEYAWVRKNVPEVPNAPKVPKVMTVGGIELQVFEVYWMPERAVAVGRGN
jgi:hypothetical protein